MVALITLMAQIGAYVPAESAHVGLEDSSISSSADKSYGIQVAKLAGQPFSTLPHFLAPLQRGETPLLRHSICE